MNIDYKALTDGIDPQFRVRAGQLAKIMQDLNYGQHVQSSWAKADVVQNHPCGTPQCALGWGIGSNLTPGVTLGVAAYVRYISTIDDEGPDEDDIAYELLRSYPSAQKLDEDGSIMLRLDTMTREDYSRYMAARSDDDNRYPVAVRDADGKVLGWSEVGSEFFGAAVMEGVFATGEHTTGEVVRLLLQYADLGYISDEWDKTYIIAKEGEEADAVKAQLDGWVVREAAKPKQHVCIGFYREE